MEQNATAGGVYQIESTGDVAVEVIDHHSNASESEDGPYLPKERFYEQVEILKSGWVRCVGPKEDRDDSDQTKAVDYFPPECVAGMYSVEESG